MLVPKALMDPLLEEIITTADRMFDVYGKDSVQKKEYCDRVGKLINGDTVKRLKGLIESAGGEIVLGGPEYCDVQNRYIAPTIIKEPSLDSEIMQNEIFGPILPVISYESFDDVIGLINSKEKPLAVYFAGSTSSPNIELLEEKTSSGALVVNECMVQITEGSCGFGGVGHSGSGRLSGYEAFKQWSNSKQVVVKYALNIWPYTLLAPPYEANMGLLNVLLKLINLRQGKILGGLFKLILLILAYSLIFGSLGNGEFRRNIVQGLIAFLTRWYKLSD